MFSIPFHIQRSVDIDAAIGDVYSRVSDFSTWKIWSPWLCQEPECPVRIAGDPGMAGHAQAWDGRRIGAGEMTLALARPDRELRYDLSFLRPWKSRATAGFTFGEADGGTRVTWSMQGQLPVFLFFMKKRMSAWIGCDYERGLNMLKELSETGRVPSRIEVLGVEERDGFHYTGLKDACAIEAVGPSMEANFERLGAALADGTLDPPDLMFSLYHRFDMADRHCEYTAACGYSRRPEQPPPQGMVQGDIPGHRALKVRHTGPYRHLGNAWAAAMACQRSEKLRINKGVPMYEVYVSDPRETDEAEIETAIFIPVK